MIRNLKEISWIGFIKKVGKNKMTFLGKQVRLNRLFNEKSGKILVIALDHAIGWGLIKGIERIEETLELIVQSKPDAITMQKGLIEKLYKPYAGKIPFIMKCTTFAPFHPAFDVQVGYVEEAIRLGADAIAVGCTVCGDDQKDLIYQLGIITREAASVGLPVVSHIYPKGNLIKEDERYLSKHVAYAARTAAELGVDIIKTFYTGNPKSYAEVIKSCPCKVVVSGGPKLPTVKDVLKMTKDAINTGAAGVTYGRNVWQDDNPIKVVEALKSIIHEGKSVRDALAIIDSV